MARVLDEAEQDPACAHGLVKDRENYGGPARLLAEVQKVVVADVASGRMIKCTLHVDIQEFGTDVRIRLHANGFGHQAGLEVQGSRACSSSWAW